MKNIQYGGVQSSDQCKYGQSKPWCTDVVTSTYGVGVWRTIRALWNKLKEDTCLRVGNDTKIKFWKDVWIDQVSLKDSFHDLFSICSNHNAIVDECWILKDGTSFLGDI